MRDEPSREPLPDRYTSGDEIARGGMGRVVEATDTLLGRVVAVKEALSGDPDGLRRFAREMRITARLEHPSIVPVYDAGTLADGSPYYVMRKVSGRPLEELIAAAATLDDRLALLPNLCAAAMAVAHAHGRGIIHRDLKPSNILVGTLGETVVIDWGLAKAIGEPDDAPAPAPQVDAGGSLRTRIGTVLGTPGFMAPEQLNAVDVDERADVYALGASLYFLLAQRPPHAAPTGDDMIAAAGKGPPTPIADLVPGTPPELSTIIDKALAYDLGVRYADAGALASDLQRFLTGQFVASHHYSRLARLRRFVRRNRTAVGIAVAAVVLLAIGGWIAVGRVVSARDEAVTELHAADLARHRETERATDLVLSQARLLVETNPAAAIALVKPFAGTDRWREVRAIAAGARSRGVPVSLPASDIVAAVDFSPDGMQGLSLGRDGVLRIYEFSTRATRTLGTFDHARAAMFVDAAHVAVFSRASFLLVDLATAARRVVPVEVEHAESVRGVLFASLAGGHLISFDAEGAWTSRAEVGDEISRLTPSADGALLALSSNHHLYVYDATGGVPLEPILDGNIEQVSWSHDEPRLIAVVLNQVFDIRLAPTRSVTSVQRTGTSVAIAQGQIYGVGPRTIVDGQPLDGLHQPVNESGAHLAREGILLTGNTTTGAIRLHDGGRHIEIPSPIPELAAIFTSVHSSYFLSLARDTLFLWNVEDVLGRHTELPGVLATTIAGYSLLATGREVPTRWIDTRDHSETQLDTMLLAGAHASPSGGSLGAVDYGSHVALVAHRGQPHVDQLGEHVTADQLIDDAHLVIGTSDGTITLHDLASRQSKTLTSHPAQVDRIRIKGTWLLAIFADDFRWRYNLATGHATSLVVPQPGTTSVTSDGRAWLSVGTHLRTWRVDGSVSDQVVLPKPIIRAWCIDDHHVIAATEDQHYLVDVDTPDRFAPTVRMAASGPIRLAEGLAVALLVGGGIALLDTTANVWWPVARFAARTATIAGDDNALIAIAGQGYDFWSLDLPRSPEATVAWIDAITNATYDTATGALVWHGVVLQPRR